MVRPLWTSRNHSALSKSSSVGEQRNSALKRNSTKRQKKAGGLAEKSGIRYVASCVDVDSHGHMCRVPRHRCEPARIPNVRIDGDNGVPAETVEATCLNSFKSQLNRNEPLHEHELCPQRPPEPFVDAARAAAFLCCSRKHVLYLARTGQITAYPRGGKSRRTWLFRLSDLEAYVLTCAGRSSHSNELEAV